MQCKQGIRHIAARVVPVTLDLEPKVEEVFTNVIDSPRMTCADQTGMFLVLSKSDDFFMVLHECDASAILAELSHDGKITSLQNLFIMLHNKIC